MTKADAVPLVTAIHGILDRVDVQAPRLQHGDGEATWILIKDAVRRGLDSRVSAACHLGAGDARVR